MKKIFSWLLVIGSGIFVVGALASSNTSSLPGVASSATPDLASPIATTRTQAQVRAVPAIKPVPTATPRKPLITHQYLPTTETLFYTSESKLDYTRDLGTSTIIQHGVNGSKTTTYDIAYSDGIETGRVATETTVISAVNQITAMGMKSKPLPTVDVAPTYYENSAGNQVQSPTHYNTQPSGASALCRDGTYSFSQSRSGTCSHHGGVQSWL